MELTRHEFDKHIEQLLRALNAVSHEKSIALSRWELIGEKDSLHLSHPSIVTHHKSCGRERSMQEPSTNDNREDIWLEDNQIFDDPHLHSPDKCDDEEPIQWDFSVVFSETYKAPVLYFRAQTLEGSPCERSKVLNLLPCQHIQDQWDFISQEEHPHSGLPSFFLHPCQTSNRLGLLMKGREGANVLWTWMSMVLPAVNQSIPSLYFKCIQDYMESEEHNTVLPYK